MMKLLLFPHSHFCEKARWALDYKGLDYQAVPVMPGLHIYTVRRYAQDTSVPVLLDGETAVQDSKAIITYLDEHYAQHPLTPVDAALRAQSLQIEQTMDEEIGVNIRLILYHRLLAYPDLIEYCFMHQAPLYKRMLFKILYPALRKRIYQVYVKSDDYVEAAKQRFDDALQHLNATLSQQKFLVGDCFTRADLSAASMLAFISEPAQHPFPWPQQHPDEMVNDWLARYQDCAAVQWSREIYQQYRHIHS